MPSDELTPAQQFGQRFKAARQAAGLTQTAVAKALGTTQPRIVEWESGREIPTLMRVYEAIDLLELDEAAVLLRPKGERTAKSDRKQKP